MNSKSDRSIACMTYIRNVMKENKFVPRVSSFCAGSVAFAFHSHLLARAESGQSLCGAYAALPPGESVMIRVCRSNFDLRELCAQIPAGKSVVYSLTLSYDMNTSVVSMWRSIEGIDRVVGIMSIKRVSVNDEVNARFNAARDTVLNSYPKQGILRSTNAIRKSLSAIALLSFNRVQNTQLRSIDMLDVDGWVVGHTREDRMSWITHFRAIVRWLVMAQDDMDAIGASETPLNIVTNAFGEFFINYNGNVMLPKLKFGVLTVLRFARGYTFVSSDGGILPYEYLTEDSDLTKYFLSGKSVTEFIRIPFPLIDSFGHFINSLESFLTTVSSGCGRGLKFDMQNFDGLLPHQALFSQNIPPSYLRRYV